MFNGLYWREKQQTSGREEEGGDEYLELFQNEMGISAVCNFVGFHPRGDGEE